MALYEDLLDGFRSFSKAMYSSWYYFAPGNLLLDCGEGVGTALGNFVFGIEKVFISHGHYDHAGGLPGLLLARNMAMGEKTKPIEIIYPEGDYFMKLIHDFTQKLGESFQFEVKWTPIKAGTGIPLTSGGNKWFIHAFATKHMKNGKSLGYILCENRTRLVEELKNLDGKAIAEYIKTHGKNKAMESYIKKLFVYGGDSTQLSLEDTEEAEVLIHDATFLDRNDRKMMSHASVSEALECGVKSSCSCLVLTHISSRYKRDELKTKLPGLVKKSGYDRPLYLQLKNRLISYPLG